MITRLFIKYFLNVVEHVDELDLYDDIEIPLNMQVCDITKISEKKSSYSLNFSIPASKHNQEILKNTSASYTSYNEWYGKIGIDLCEQLNVIVYQNDIEVFTGVLIINDILYSYNTPIEYKCSIYSGVIDFLTKINDPSKDGAFQSLSTLLSKYYNITPQTNESFISYCGDAPFTTEVGYCQIDWKNKMGPGKTDWRGYEVTPYVSVPHVLDKIITRAGYKWESKFFRHHIDSYWDIDENLPDEYKYPNCLNPYIYNPDERYPNNHVFTPKNLILPATNNPMDIDYKSVGISDENFALAETKLYVEPNQYDNFMQCSWNLTYPTYLDNINRTWVNLVEISQGGGLTLDTTSGIQVSGLPKSGGTLDNSRFVAPCRGWYRFSGKFDWSLSANTYDNNNEAATTQKVVYKPGDWDNPDQDTADLSSANAYRITFGLSVNGYIREEPFYENSATCEAMCDFHTGKKRRIKSAGNYGFVIASSDEYSNYNASESDDTVVTTSVNNWTLNKPCEYDRILWLEAGDTVGLYVNIFLRQTFNGEWCMRNTSLHNVSFGAGAVQIREIPNEPIFLSSLIDRVGPQRTVSWEDFLNYDYTPLEFLKDLCKIFNLYIEDVSNKPRYDDNHIGEYYPNHTLYIDPRDFYYVQENSQKPYRWSLDDFIDNTTIKTYRPDDYLNKKVEFLFGSKSSSEAMLEEYNSANIPTYSGAVISKGNTSDIESIQTSLTTSICASDVNNHLCPRLFSSSGENGFSTPKIFFGQQAYAEVEIDWQTYGRLCTPNLYDGMNSRGGNAESATTMKAALEYYVQSKYYPPYNYNTGTDFYIPRNNLYNTFYENNINEITAEGSRIIEAEAYIPDNFIRNLRMNDLVKYDSVMWYILKIDSWTNKNQPCKITLLKFNPSINYGSNYNVRNLIYTQTKKWY